MDMNKENTPMQGQTTGGAFFYNEQEGITNYKNATYENMYRVSEVDTNKKKTNKRKDKTDHKDKKTLATAVTLVVCACVLIGLTIAVFRLRYGASSSGGPSQTPIATNDAGDTGVTTSEIQDEDTATTGLTSEETQTEGIGSAETGATQITLNIAATADEVETYATQVVEKTLPTIVAIDNNFTERSRTIYGVYEEEVMTTGSGIIIGASNTELLIVTNNHVVSGAEDLKVNFYGGGTAPATIRGTNSALDLAVIIVNTSDVDAQTMSMIGVATLGDSDRLKLGEPIIAIGNALGYGQSVTTGVVSAVNREITMEDGTSGVYIQIDAAINHGNSGGALLNSRGEVIGINTAKLSETSVEGMGFAIPITQARATIEKLMSIGARQMVPAEQKGYLGVQVGVTQDMEGAYIAGVVSGSCAEKAGLAVGDVIVAVEEIEVTSNSELVDAMNYFKIGDSVNLTVMKKTMGGYTKTQVTLTLEAKPQG